MQFLGFCGPNRYVSLNTRFWEFHKDILNMAILVSLGGLKSETISSAILLVLTSGEFLEPPPTKSNKFPFINRQFFRGKHNEFYQFQ